MVKNLLLLSGCLYVALILSGCGEKGLKCEGEETRKAVMDSVSKTIKQQLAQKQNPSIVGDEWQNFLNPEQKTLVELSYTEYGPMLANTSMITENKEAKTVDCSGEIKFRNGQVFKIYFKLQKDTNGKLDAHVEWL